MNITKTIYVDYSKCKLFRTKYTFILFQPENLMLSSRDCDDENLQLKIIDFGLSREFNEGQETRELLGTPEFVG